MRFINSYPELSVHSVLFSFCCSVEQRQPRGEGGTRRVSRGRILWVPEGFFFFLFVSFSTRYRGFTAQIGPQSEKKKKNLWHPG